jgi:transposase-like protein
MQCPKCKAQVIVEDLGEGHQRLKCSKCGLNEVRDREGRKLLVDTREESGTLLS